MSLDRQIGSHWLMKQKIGSGSFGEIFLGIDTRTNQKVAIKLERLDAEYPQLEAEYTVYMSMKTGSRGIPKIYWFGMSGNYNVLIMELLGPSLETLYNMCERKFSLKTVSMLAIELLRRIEFQHTNQYLHRDIKPDNFLMGLRQNSHIVFMIDMGLSKRFEDPETQRHIPYRENRKLIGTPRYTSINTHLGVEQTRRDDLESIAYMLLYFLRGKLPWQGLRAKTKEDKYQRILMKKMGTKVADLCKGFPDEFATFLKYAKELKFPDKPNYKHLRRLFYDLFRREGWTDDCIFDWMELPEWETETRRFEYAHVTGSVDPLPIPISSVGSSALRRSRGNVKAGKSPSVMAVDKTKALQEQVQSLREAYDSSEAAKDVLKRERDRWKKQYESTIAVVKRLRADKQRLQDEVRRLTEQADSDRRVKRKVELPDGQLAAISVLDSRDCPDLSKNNDTNGS
eukprot:gb/GEZN01007520.1/.p1 GENE.gb/GEZN01007520.1/~~gb/GEZN01007520.1/.p1  ORF type:complete len:455 (+),score=54.07 gb/GEZN01007520.1/:94-1458(+)